LFPFFLVNLLMGLTRMPLRNFFFVSILGMAPATILFVNAGTELASLESPTGILSPRILFSLAALGIFPWLAKAFVSLLESRRVYARFQKPKKFDYNMIVIGAGAAGLVSSLIAATLRARVLLIEKHKMGGDCLNTGCVPSKAIIRSAKLVHQAKNSSALGLSPVEIPVDFAKVMDRVTSVVRAIEPHDSVERYTKLGVECLAGNACLIDPWTVEVDGKKLTTRNIILASGAEPALPTFPGLDQVKFFTTDTLWNLRELPKRLLILGGGPIGCELAQAFSRLGARVTQVEANDRILAREDSDVAEVVTERFRSEGIEILARHRALRFEQKGDSGIAVLETNGQEKRVEFDAVLIALGRKARTKGFGLEALGVQLKKSGEIEADSFLRTNFPNIYVCGDATGPYQFTHMAAHQAWFASINALFAPFWKFKVDYRIVPWCTYTDPEVARVGLSESEAKSKGIQVDVTKYGIDDLDRAIADGETHGFVKVLTQPGSDKILGATIVGAHAGEILIEFVTAMKFGIGLGKILQTIHSYPTFAEANKFAAGVWRKERAPEGLLRILGKIHSARR
jgi:pyruvate/2-oxoglutarate dehydrogenase complex dihydrolipoamide dehydrogenase (E3) component